MALCALVVGAAWSLASPPGAAPDDNFHLASIWCAYGFNGDCGRVSGQPDQRLLPSEVPAASCFAQDPEKSGACQEAQDGVLRLDAPVNDGNWRGSYPPVFYDVLHPLIGDSFYGSIVRMRLFNAFLVVAMLAALGALVPRRLRAVATVPMLVTSVPLGISLLASTNPSSWTMVNAAVLWVALYSAFETAGRRRVGLWALALLAEVIGAGARADAAIFSAVAVALVLLLRAGAWRDARRHVGTLVVALVCTVIGAAFFLSAGQSSVVSAGFGVGNGESTSTAELVVANLQQLPVLWVGGLGFGFMGSIGWLDTVFPPLVSFLTLAIWAGLVFSGWRVQSRLKMLGLLALAAALTVYPMYLLTKSHLSVGQGFQPRYLLPLLIMLTGLSLLPVRRHRLRLSGTQVTVAAAGLGIAQLIALYTQLRRYVTGSDRSGWNLDAGREWWWGGPFSATFVWVAGSVAFLLLSYGLLRLLAGPEPIEAEDDTATVDRVPARDERAQPVSA